MKRIFIICPVRDVTEEEKQFIEDYVLNLEQKGNKVHWPQRDTNQVDPLGGIRICIDNNKAIWQADEVHVYWNNKSQGSFFDLGMAFAYYQLPDTNIKSIRLINKIEVTKNKSFNNVLLWLNNEHK